MGTSIEYNWLYTNRDGETFELVQHPHTGVTTGLWYNSSGSYAFRFENGQLLFGVSFPPRAMAFGWKCVD